MGFKDKLAGHVESITRAISSPNAAVSIQGLPSVEAVYTGVRPADSRSNQNRQRAADDNARCRLDSDGDCHPLCSPNVNGPK
jgi:hypothetical protein